MDVLNIMWSGGTAFVSVQKVHRDILRHTGPGAEVETLLLQAGAAEPLAGIGPVTSVGLNAGRIKGRGLGAMRRLLDQRRLRAWIFERQPGILLLDGIGVAAFVLPLLRNIPVARAVVLFHGAKRLKPAEVDLLSSFPENRVMLAAVSDTLAADLESQSGCAVRGCRVAIEPCAFRSALWKREAARNALGLGESRKRVIGAVGRLVAEKGFELLLVAMADWLVENPEDHLVIVGDGPERQRLAEKARRLGIADQVSLVGHHPSAPQLYLAFDLVCIPSEQEGLGLVLPEAVIAGVPVLASDLPVFREQLSGSAGLVPFGDLAHWQNALRQALSGEAGQLAEAQRSGLNPEAAWLNFVAACRKLLVA